MEETDELVLEYGRSKDRLDQLNKLIEEHGVEIPEEDSESLDDDYAVKILQLIKPLLMRTVELLDEVYDSE